ncbi:hypothetical protein HELRODRAFT_131366, partial [Helobdella robusta]|uniref:PUM-HD domain-containing protein n=1 Tax=Helobdella robusta TaxID=6412 RepID=T1EHV7_HELRO
RLSGLPLSSAVGCLVDLAKDQFGSRYLQEKLESATTTSVSIITNELLPHIISLSMDLFGNYVVQKLLHNCDNDQRLKIKNKIINSIYDLSKHMYGCRVVQKAFEVFCDDYKFEMINELNGNVLACCYNQNANHVIQKAIEQVKYEHVWLIVDQIKGKVSVLSNHPYACRIIQRLVCLERLSEQDSSFIREEIFASIESLIHDQYGNYVIQYLVEKGGDRARHVVMEWVRGRVVQLSQHKYSSNVIEKCMMFADDEQRNFLFTEILGCDTTHPTRPHIHPLRSISSLLRDRFGNYVVQRMFEIADDRQNKMLLTHIKPHVNILKSYPYGKYILAKMEKIKNSNS